MISIKDGDFFVNDIKIVRPKVITQTGVVHYVEKVSFLFSLSCCSGLGRLGEKAKSFLGHWPLQRPAPAKQRYHRGGEVVGEASDQPFHHATCHSSSDCRIPSDDLSISRGFDFFSLWLGAQGVCV